MVKRYINLPNGVEMVPELLKKGYQFSFVRIQSEHCEKKQWEAILLDLDYDFLLNLALGHECIVYDCGRSSVTSRALTQGIDWIKFALNRRWHGKQNKIFIGNRDWTLYFEDEYKKLSRKTRDRLDYFAKFVIKNRILKISREYMVSENYKDYVFLKNVLKEWSVNNEN